MTTQKQQEKIFVTGASGYVGSVVTELATAKGYIVHGLSRSETSDNKLRSLGAVPVRGDLTSLEVLRRESTEADAVIHLATAYKFGAGTYDAAMPIDIAAVDAIADGLAGTNKPLVFTLGTLVVAADPTGAETTETSPLDPNPISSRIKTAEYSFTLARRGIRVMEVRLAPFVYGRGGSGIKLFMDMSRKTGNVICVDGGKNYTTIVHVDDAAELYLLAAKKGKTGDVFNASGATDVTTRQIFDAIAATVNLPVRNLTYTEALEEVGETFTRLLSAANRASGAKAVKELGWKPDGLGILDDINKGSYQGL